MHNILIIGAGGVGSVVAHKCAMLPGTFGEITLASRTLSKCDDIAASVKARTGREIATAKVDADNSDETAALIQKTGAKLLINVALPYQDLNLMDACLKAGIHYMDTANYEPLDVAKFEYPWQWAYQEKFAKAGLSALLGSGFDPGVTNVFTAWALKHHFDEIHTLDIIDVNGGDHGRAFATNFNPEINIREVTAECRHWEDGKFVETAPMSLHQPFTCPDGVGTYEIYRMYHEELESLVAAGIPFHIVPGITAASGCASYAGIPLTHRDYSQSVRFVTCHPKGGNVDLAWREFAHKNQTIVFYMGLGGLATIAAQLVLHGRDASTPVAVISNGTLPTQKVVIGNLADIVERVKTAQLQRPTLIIVGEVVSFRETLGMG